MPFRCPECFGDNPLGTFYCKDCGSALLPEAMIPEEARRARAGAAIAGQESAAGTGGQPKVITDEVAEQRRYRIVLGDDCPICKAVARISFAPERPPRIPIAGCREAGGCRCSLPVFGDVLTAEPAAVEIVRPEPATEESPPTAPAPVAEAPPSRPRRIQSPPLRDEGTGAYTWQAFVELGNIMAQQAIRRGSPLGLLLIALDDSAAMAADSNPMVEHATLLGLARLLQRTVRSGDVLGRYGPRSLGLLASDASRAGAVELAHRVTSAWREHLKAHGIASAFGASIGVASMPDAGSTFEKLLYEAEQALGEAIGHGGNTAWASGSFGMSELIPPASAEPAGPGAQPAALLAEIAARRCEGLAEATAAFQRGESEGVAVRAQPNSCPVCRNAAEDIYTPQMVPPLPLIGCTNPGGCRCVYVLPVFDARHRPPPLQQELYENLDIPRRLHDAALYGTRSKGRCKPQRLAEYLDAFPLLPGETDFPLQHNESVYFQRDARRGWESDVAALTAIHGPAFPLSGKLSPALETLVRPPVTATDAVPYPENGTMFITNWRIIFRRDRRIDSLLLVDISGIELMRDGVACVVGKRDQRLFFLVRDALQTGLVLARAVRDVRIYMS